MCGSPVRWIRVALRALAVAGCFVAAAGPAARAQTFPGPTQSTPIALSRDNSLLLNVNPAVGTVSVFNVAGATPVKLAEITVGGDPESVAVHPNGTLAYVANAVSGTVSVINLQTLTVTTTISVGVEPAAVALSPAGSLLYVANSASNSLSVINTATNTLVSPTPTTVDLSPFGTAPRAIAVTNNGGADSAQTVFVALFYAQLRPGQTFLQEGQDNQREGRVVAVSAATNTVMGTAIALEPLANTGFNANGQLAPATGLTPAVASTNPATTTTVTGAFPNQLAAIALHPTNNKGYVVSTGASPNGPLKFNVMNQGLLSVFDAVARTEITAAQTDPNVRRTAPLNLNQGVNLAGTPSPTLFLTNPLALAWRPDGSDAWVVIQNSDLVARVTVDAGGIPTVGAPLPGPPVTTSQIVRVDLEAVAAGQIAGTAPRGIAINSTGTLAFVSNFTSRSVTVINISNPTAPTIAATFQSTALPAPGTIAAVVQQGALLFFTGRGPQGRMSNSSWGGCIVCHPFGGRSDNVTWMFDTGPRQTIPLDGTFNKQNSFDQRILNWSAVRDEIHDFELNTRNVFGGRGLIDDDRLFYAVGGASGATPADSGLIEQFQQLTFAVGTTNDLQGGAPLPTLNGLTPRRDFGLATLNDGRMLIIGGRSGAGQGTLVPAANAVLEFNPRKKGLIVRSATGFTLRHSLGAAAVHTSQGDRVYAVGGYASTSAAAAPVTTVEEYNPATDTWRTVMPLTTAVAQFGITVAGGVNTAEPLQRIHVVSGNTGSEGTPSVTNSTQVQRFQADPAGPGAWTPFNPGLTLRRNLGAAAALRGVASRVFVIGGQDATGTTLTTVEEYLAEAGTLQATPHTPLPAPLSRFGIGTTLSSNQIYVMGGLDNAGTDQTAVLEYTTNLDPPPPGTPGPAGTPSGAWVKRADLSLARHGLAVNSPPGVTNFLPVRNTGRDPRQDAIALWVSRKVRSARAPVPANNSAAMAGRTLFGTVGLVQPGFSCATCHGGPKWTRSQVDYSPPPSPNLTLGNQLVIGAELRQTTTQGPNAGQFPGVLLNVGTFTLGGGRVNEVRFNAADPGQAINPLGANGFNIPSLLSVHETAPYFYSGLAQTLGNVLDGSQDTNGGTRHHFVTDPTNRANLVQFLRSIDDTTPIFP